MKKCNICREDNSDGQETKVTVMKIFKFKVWICQRCISTLFRGCDPEK